MVCLLILSLHTTILRLSFLFPLSVYIVLIFYSLNLILFIVFVPSLSTVPITVMLYPLSLPSKPSNENVLALLLQFGSVNVCPFQTTLFPSILPPLPVSVLPNPTFYLPFSTSSVPISFLFVWVLSSPPSPIKKFKSKSSQALVLLLQNFHLLFYFTNCRVLSVNLQSKTSQVFSNLLISSHFYHLSLYLLLSLLSQRAPLLFISEL